MSSPAANAIPKITVVIPTRDRAARLRRLIASLGGQTLPSEDFEVVVVDDGSSEALDSIDSRDGIAVRVLRLERSRGPGAARNLGWRSARAPLVAFTDDDCRAAPAWLEALLEASKQAPGAIVQGRTLPDPEGPDPLGPFSLTQRVHGPNGLYQTCNIAYPRDLLELVGGFDERYRHAAGEDVELGWRTRHAGADLAFSREALVYHEVTNTGLVPTLRKTFHMTDAVRVLKAWPETRRLLQGRLFWRPAHAPMLLGVGLLLIAAISGRSRMAPLAAVPYVLHYRRRYAGRDRPWRSVARLLPRHLIIDVAELATMIAGSVRHRTIVL